MNRFFEFSSAQIKLILILVGLLVVVSAYQFLRDYSIADKDSFDLAVTIGGDSKQYRPVFIVNLNYSPIDSLELIPGIGPVLASRIVAFRDSAGSFNSIDEILKVDGIGYRNFERIKPYIEVGP
jgi:competence ComEA-like helix-hairpin-helix protein